ncbi:MAG: aldehyde dehydrogenase family protein [Pyrinomonadaceae bacterium]
MKHESILKELGVPASGPGSCSGPDEWHGADGEVLESFNPANGEKLGEVRMASRADYDKIVDKTVAAFPKWRDMPAPKRGQVVRDLGNAIREKMEALGDLVTLEMGKIRTEGHGEVQEMIDICDFAVGLSRQLCGSTMHSERPGHRMYEQYHPLGAIGIISAFNFPVAVWSWNAALAAVCGNTMVWKPSPTTPLSSIAVQNICNTVMADHGLSGLFSLVIGKNDEVAVPMVEDKRLPLISFTGSCGIGKRVAQTVAGRMGKSLLELGGNNAIIVAEDADLELAIRAILFGAVGTAGQRCTSTRRLIVHESRVDELMDRLVKSYGTVTIGDPLEDGILMGPVVSANTVAMYKTAIETAVSEGGEVLVGNEVLDRAGHYVKPTILRMPAQTSQVKEETFAPILYVLTYSDIEMAIELHNDVPQGLSSAIFTESMKTAERFLSAAGSDCGIANVNIGTSGAEIGGAFGGEKETGGGRESGSDAWKFYMRRQTNTINYSNELPLAQGVQFG